MRSRVARIAIAGIALLAIAGIFVAVGPSAAAASAPSSGFNDQSCRPSTTHPYPLVLLHGLTANGQLNFTEMGPYLAGLGYCVFAPTYGQSFPGSPGGLVPVAQSAKEIVADIDNVLTTTGATKVDLVGHSEGGFQSLYVPKVLNYAGKVDRVVALAPPTHGTNLDSLVYLGQLLGITSQLNTLGCGACADLIPGGPGVTALTTGPIAQPGVNYTIIASRTDEVVTPPSTAFIEEPGVTNEYVQDTCPLDLVGHIGLAIDSGVFQLVANALDPNSAKPVSCAIGFPL
jgi:triacylglycerol esterase/lipase EstA (alpha/beta hydrolase family)